MWGHVWNVSIPGVLLNLLEVVFNINTCAFSVRLILFNMWKMSMSLPTADQAEFARCPQPLPLGSPSLPVSSCELNKNTRRCHQQPLATHLSCRLYQTCDHAVLISGRACVFVFFWHLDCSHMYTISKIPKCANSFDVKNAIINWSTLVGLQYPKSNWGHSPFPSLSSFPVIPLLSPL